MNDTIDQATQHFRACLIALCAGDTRRALRHARGLLLALVALLPESRRGDET